MIIRELYELPGVSFGPLIDSFQDYNIKNKRILGLLKGLPPAVSKSILNTGAGVEVEIEGVGDAKELAGWNIVPDHSLRNQGAEYVSKVGKRVHNLYPMLEQLFSHARAASWQTSDRTSIHVHINTQNITMEQLNSLVILYTIFERSLFTFACDERRSNIFCVPLEYCMTVGNHSMRHLVDNTAKYAAMNLHAVREKGTVEFRQMSTSFDEEKVFLWVLLLALIKRAAAHFPLIDIKAEVKQLKFSSDYDNFLQKVFYTFSELLTYKQKDIDAAVSDSKLFFFGDN